MNFNPSFWDITEVTLLTNTFDSMSAWENQYYSSMLISWAAQTVKPNLELGANLAKYSANAAAARDTLVTDNNWIIFDAGLE